MGKEIRRRLREWKIVLRKIISVVVRGVGKMLMEKYFRNADGSGKVTYG